jgi:cellulose synthase/poly-beta-1,6-N-acetylglucosamine synthase-like glycosyltransferase
MEMVFRLHRFMRDEGRPYRIVATPDPICWTEVPSTLRALRRQRNGWQRGLLEVLWRHRGMLFNPRYGRVGMVAVPYLWFFEAGAAFVEGGGYFYVVVAAIFGFLNVEFALMFFALAVLFGILLSQLAMGIETMLLSRYERPSDRLVLFVAAFAEFAGIRQALLWERCIAIFQLRRLRGKFWTETRTGIDTGNPPGP